MKFGGTSLIRRLQRLGFSLEDAGTIASGVAPGGSGGGLNTAEQFAGVGYNLKDEGFVPGMTTQVAVSESERYALVSAQMVFSGANPVRGRLVMGDTVIWPGAHDSNAINQWTLGKSSVGLHSQSGHQLWETGLIPVSIPPNDDPDLTLAVHTAPSIDLADRLIVSGSFLAIWL